MQIANTVRDSIVDGPGLRFTVFVQGCPHHCPGCHNPGTWPAEGGQQRDVEELAAEVLQDPLCDGLTLSGGEPFGQARACAALAQKVKAAGKSVWVYSGYRYETLLHGGRVDWLELLESADVLVDGPFVREEQSYGALYRGSRNQRLIDLNRTRETGQLTLWSRGDTLAHFTRPES